MPFDAEQRTEAVVAWIRGGGLSAVSRAVTTFVAVLSVGLILAAFVWPEPAAPTVAKNLPAGAPQKLIIPSLKASAFVEPLKNEDGVLNPPDDFRTVGWWAASAKPGSHAGQIVITGHTIHSGGGVMDLVPNLKFGDRIDVTTSKATFTFMVTNSKIYSRAELSKKANLLFGQGLGTGGLVLVTCTDFDGVEYTENIVVYAIPVGGTLKGHK